MKKIRSNRGGLYPTGESKKAGHPDSYYDKTCSGCGKVIPKEDSNITIPGKGDFCWGCKPNKTEVKK